jgi:methionyl-tRNA formyltransferase
MRPTRLVVFAHARAWSSVVLCQAAARAVRARGEQVVIAAFVDAARGTQSGGGPAFQLAAALARRLFDSTQPLALERPILARVPQVARRSGVPLLVPANRDINEPGFVALLRAELRPDAALNLCATQIFRPELLAVFPAGVVNYHNGLLPGYRGVGATAWSVYRGDSTTGLSFHRMSAGIDEGPILVQGTIPVRHGASLCELETEKVLRAAALLPEALDALLAGDPGQPQAGEPAYFSLRDRRAITRIRDPGEIAYAEIERRLRAFGVLHMSLGGERYGVTRVRRTNPHGTRPRRLSFTTADGVAAEADRLDFLPPGLHRLRATLR